ncbi:hypothetical protein MalM25_00820 [Planctomycetes bacterium MalM25]|nr:hypothetical protein MalM25_00820 [Planctomycetes bacterium MalM25]
MSDAPTEAPASDPLRSLVDDWSQAEESRVAEVDGLLEPIEQALGQLVEWADRLATNQQAEAEQREEADARTQAGDDRRRRLEHDLKLARARVADLERMLHDRTEELLRAQEANNQLAAELQAIGDDDPALAAISIDEEAAGEGPPTEDPTDEAANAASDGGVAQRFAALRHGE